MENNKWTLDNGVLTVLPGVTTIELGAFYNAERTVRDAIETIILPEGLKVIEDNAFNGCKAVKSIRFPEGLEEIGAYAFESSELLTHVQLPDSVCKLGIKVFPVTTTVECAYLTAEKKRIADAIAQGKSCLIKEGIDLSVVQTLVTSGYELVEESSLASLATFLCPDGAIMAQGVKCFPHCIMPMIEHPDKQFVLYLDYLDYSNMTNFEWLRSILSHRVNGREINNYVVVGHLLGDALNFDYDQVRALFN